MYHESNHIIVESAYSNLVQLRKSPKLPLEGGSRYHVILGYHYTCNNN